MPAVPAEARPFIAQYQLGTPKKVYKPATITTIIVGLFIILFACAWILLALFITGSPLLPANLFPFPTSLIPQLTDAPFTTILAIGQIVFPLFGLIFVAAGVVMIIRALLNQHMRAVLCEDGLVYMGRKEVDAFRWEQVALVLDKLHVHTSTTTQASGMNSASTSTSHTYTVVCKDGRRFLFNNVLAKTEELGQEMQIAVALYQKSV